MISQDNPLDNLYFGTVGLFGAKPNNKFLKSKADLVIVVGNRLTEDDTANFRFPPQRTSMIQIDIEPSEIGLSYKPWGIVGDPKAALFEIIRRLRKTSVRKELTEELRVNECTVAKWERGGSQPMPYMLERIQAFLADHSS